MATEPVQSSVSTPLASPGLQPLQALLARLGLSGKILAIGALVGAIAVFLPLFTISMQMPGDGNLFGGKAAAKIPSFNTSQTFLVIGDWRGILCLLGYCAGLGLIFLLYPIGGLSQKNLGWAGVGVGGFITLLAFWLLISALNGSSVMSFGGMLQVSVGIGAILNLLAAAAVTAGGVLKAREEKLF